MRTRGDETQCYIKIGGKGKTKRIPNETLVPTVGFSFKPISVVCPPTVYCFDWEQVMHNALWYVGLFSRLCISPQSARGTHACTVHINFPLSPLPLTRPFFCILHCLAQQLRKWRGWRPCAPSHWFPAPTVHPSDAEASSPLWGGCWSPGSGGRRRVRSSSRLLPVWELIVCPNCMAEKCVGTQTRIHIHTGTYTHKYVHAQVHTHILYTQVHTHRYSTYTQACRHASTNI